MQDRQSERVNTHFLGAYRTPRGFVCEVEVDDLSLGGCRVDDPRGGLRLGEYVEITLGDAEPIVAEVAWRQTTRVGLQFNRPLSPEVFQALTGVAVKIKAPPAPHPERPAKPSFTAQPGATSARDLPPPSPGVRRFL